MKIYPDGFELNKYTLRDFNARKRFTRNYAWALPSYKAIRSIVSFAAGELITEIGAGKGYWASLISKSHGNIRCFDLSSVVTDYFYSEGDSKRVSPFYPVEFKNSYDEVLNSARESNILFFCWPEWGKDWAAKYVKAINPQKIIYIGEYRGGCTGNDELFDILEEKYALKEIISIPRWDWVNDFLGLYEYK